MGVIDGRMVRFTPNGLSVMSRQRFDFFGEVFRLAGRMRGDEAERAGIGDGGDQFALCRRGSCRRT